MFDPSLRDLMASHAERLKSTIPKRDGITTMLLDVVDDGCRSHPLLSETHHAQRLHLQMTRRRFFQALLSYQRR
jgi:hypothetical protein